MRPLSSSRWALGALVVALLVALSLRSASKSERPARAKPTGVLQPKDMADSLYAVIAANREVYTRVVVRRLQEQEKVIQCSERWLEEKALPTPSQMLRMSAEAVQSKGAEFSYTLRSLWPINPRNAPETQTEKQGLEFVSTHPKENFYAAESLGGRRYLTAVYPDAAFDSICVTCHNAHPRSPRKDFKSGEVLGGVVVRVALEF